MGVFSRMDIEKDNIRESPSKKFRTSIANKAKIDEEYKKYQQKYNKKVRKPITIDHDENSNEQDDERY